MKTRWMLLGSLLTLAMIVGVVVLGGVVLAQDNDASAEPGDSQVQDENESTLNTPLFGRHRDGSHPRAMFQQKPGMMGKHMHGPMGQHMGEMCFDGAPEDCPPLVHLAEIIGITPQSLYDALEAGQTLTEIAAANGMERQELIDALLAEAEEHLALAADGGLFDQEQLAFIRDWLNDGVELLVDHPLPIGEEWQALHGQHIRRDLLDAEDFDLPDRLAELLGLSLQELADAILDGQSLAEIAQAQNIEPQTVIDWLVAEIQQEIDEAVAAGYLSEEQADLLRSWVADSVEVVVYNPLVPPGGFELLGRFGNMFGKRFGRMDMDWQSWAEYDWVGLIGQDPISVAADAIGISRGELMEALADGQTMAEIAETHNADLDAVINAQTESMETLLDDLAAQGMIPDGVLDLADGHLEQGLRMFADQGFPFGRWEGMGDRWMQPDWFDGCPCDHLEKGD